MSYERSKAPLALMEQLIMILVFALTAAVCLQAFVYSDSLSKKGSQKDAAITHAQQVAEYWKTEKDFDRVCDKLSGQRTEEGLEVSYPKDKMTVYLSLDEEASSEYLMMSHISVLGEGKEELVSMDVACQRGGGEN